MTKLGPYELNTIVTGDCRELAEAIPAESVDLIFTDPVYDRIDDYEWLAETAVRILKPDAALLCFCGIGLLPETLDALRLGGMKYRWELTSAWNGGSAHIPLGFCKQARLLWFDKFGISKPNRQLVDLRQSVVNNSKLPDCSAHDWTKIPDHIAYWLEGFSASGDSVLDPFSGWGTMPSVCKMLGRNFLGFEIETIRALDARQRVLMTQPPLFVAQPEQVPLFVEAV